MKKNYLLFILNIYIASFAQPYSNGMYFDGDDYIDVPFTTNINSTTTNNRTYETYFKAENVSAGKRFIMKEGGSTRAVVIYTENGYLYLGAYNRADYTPLWEGTFYRTPISSNVWYHIALVFDNALPANTSTNTINVNTNTALKFYLNGTLAIEKSGYQLGGHNSIRLGYKNEALRIPHGNWTTSGSVQYLFNNNTLDNNNNTYYFEGYMWGFRVWNNVRTAAQINANKDSLILSVGTDNLVAALDGNDFTYLNSSNTAAEAITTPETVITWKSNAATTNWETATNWVGNAVPNAAKLESVRIVTSTNYPVINSNIIVGSVVLDTGTSLTVNSNYSLDIHYHFTNNGSLTIENNGSLLQQKNDPNTTAITYKRTATDIKGSDYVYWSSPVVNQNLSTIYTTPPQGPKYEWNSLINNGNGTSGNISQGNWVSPSVTMSAGKGYIVRGSSSFGLSATNINAIFSGIPNNGDVAISINRGFYTGADYIGLNGATITRFNDNYNLLGNPYPSAINALQFLDDNSAIIEGNVKLWTHGTDPSAANASPFYGNYTYNYSSSDYVTINFTGSTIPGASNIIKAGQGFFIEMIDGATGSATVKFNNEQRRDKNNSAFLLANDTFFKTSNTTKSTVRNDIEKHRIWLDIVDDNNNSETTLIGYVDGASMNFDSKYDAKTNHQNFNIYSKINNQNYSIQGRSLPFNDDDSVEIGFSTPSNGKYNIALNTVDGLFENNQDIYLKDELLNVLHDLKVAPYEFTTTSGNNENRFKIVYKNTVLNSQSFDYTDFNIIKNNNKIEITSGNEIMNSVKIYDISGRLLFTNTNVNNNSLAIDSNFTNNKILIVTIVTTSGIKVSKKIL